MHYVRFLKPVEVDLQLSQIKTLIYITSDLGDSLFPGSIALSASIVTPKSIQSIKLQHGRRFDRVMGGELYSRTILEWTPQSRVLPVKVDINQATYNFGREYVLEIRTLTPQESKIHAYNGNVKLIMPHVVGAISGGFQIMSFNHILERDYRRLVSFPFSKLQPMYMWEEGGESIARHVWDAGMALVAYFDLLLSSSPHHESILSEILRPPSAINYPKDTLQILELGAGVGLVGLALSELLTSSKTAQPHQITLTDLPDPQNVISRNLSDQSKVFQSGSEHSVLDFQILDWSEELPTAIAAKRFNLVLVSDCTYNPDSAAALVKTLEAVTERDCKSTTNPGAAASNSKTFIVVAMKKRHPSEEVFFDLMKEAGFDIIEEENVILPSIYAEEKDGIDISEAEHVDIYIFAMSSIITTRPSENTSEIEHGWTLI